MASNCRQTISECATERLVYFLADAGADADRHCFRSNCGLIIKSTTPATLFARSSEPP
jgi:hypothetical protein